MRWEIRHPERDELVKIIDLVDRGFKRTEREYFELFVPDETSFPDNAFVASIDDEIVAFLQIFPRTVRFDGEVLKMGGIGNVATDERYRGLGIASSLLQTAYEHMKENGFDISILFASRKRFYERNLWRALPTFSTIFQVEYERSPDVVDLETSKLDEDTLKWVKEMYRRFNEAFNLTVVRDDHVWKLELSYWKRRMAFSSEMRSYVIYSVTNGKRVIEDCAFEDEKDITRIFKNLGGEIIFQGFEWHPIYDVLSSISSSKEVRFLEEVYLRNVNSRIDPGRNWHYWRFDYF